MNHDRVIYKPPEVTRTEDKEIWWDVYVTTPGKVEHNRPVMVLCSGYKPRACLQEQTAEIFVSSMSTTTAVPEVYIFYYRHHCWGPRSST